MSENAIKTVELRLKGEVIQLRKVKSAIKQPLPKKYHVELEQSDDQRP